MDQLLIIDFDGTICFDRFWRSVDPDTMMKIQATFFDTDRQIVNRWMRGEHSSEEVNRILAEKHGLDYAYLWRVFVRDCQTMFVDAEVLGVLKSLRNQWRTLLMTDNMDCFTRFIKPALNLDHYFDSIVNSADHGRLKSDNEGQFFADIASKVGIPLRRSVLVDNSIKTCEHFLNLGGQACLVTEQKTIKHWLQHLPKTT